MKFDQNDSYTEAASAGLNQPGQQQQQQQFQQQQSSRDDNNSPRKDSDNRKRKYDSDNHRGGYNNGSSNKRSTRDRDRVGDEEDEVYLKMMIPAPVAGGVIGRGGDKIGQIQKEANVRMKMSKNNEHYPGTQERLCLIIGSIKAVLKAHQMVVERMQEKDGLSQICNRDSELQERVNQIKVVIPNTTAGFLIGKSGATIKNIKDESGAHVQISSKQTDLPERIVTIDGDPERRIKALSMIVRKIAEDPQHSSEPTLSYSSLVSDRGGDGSRGGSGGGYEQYGLGGVGPGLGSQQLAAAALQSATQKLDMNAAAYFMSGLNNLALLIINCGGSYQMTADNLKLSLRNAGYSSQASSEILEAITILLNYGLITKNSPATLLASNPSLANLINLGPVGLASISQALVSNMGVGGGASVGGPSQGADSQPQQYYSNGGGGGMNKRR